MNIVTVRAVALAIAICGLNPATASARRGAPAVHAGNNQVFRAGDFQSFVKNWDSDGPLCARIASQADWDRYFGAAAVMGRNKPFGPPKSLWATHNGYLLARIANGGGDVAEMLKVKGVARVGRSVKIDTVFAAPASSSFQVTSYVLVAVPKPVSGTVEFRDHGRTICSVRA